MIIRRETFLTTRSFRIHEAGHLFVGRYHNLPMSHAEIYADGSGGIAHIDREELARQAAPDDVEIPHAITVRAATQCAGLFLAGFAGEAIHAGADLGRVIGAHTSDVAKAAEFLEYAAQPVDLLDAVWTETVEILRANWPAVIELAKEIPVTSNSHWSH